jgi:hypothetical protein
MRPGRYKAQNRRALPSQVPMEHRIELRRFLCMDETRSNKSRRTVLATLSHRLRAFYLFVQTNYARDAREIFQRAEQADHIQAEQR